MYRAAVLFYFLIIIGVMLLIFLGLLIMHFGVLIFEFIKTDTIKKYINRECRREDKAAAGES